jgi:hypothetical protein
VRGADGRRVSNVGADVRDRARPRAPPASLAREHRRRGGGRARAPAGEPYRRQPGARGGGDPLLSRARGRHARGLARVASSLGPPGATERAAEAILAALAPAQRPAPGLRAAR